MNQKAVKLSGKVSLTLQATATADTRYSFTAQYLRAAKFFADCADDIEKAQGQTLDDSAWMKHRGYVVASVMQSSAALEAEIYEVLVYGPGHHLGSNGTDIQARDFLRPLVDDIDKGSALRRYEIVLHLLRRSPLTSEHVWQQADLLVRLRNELVHYKSQWGIELEPPPPAQPKKLFAALKQLKHKSPPWLAGGHSNYFPHHCLNADLAAWCPRAAGAFLLAFYARLGISSPIDHCTKELGL